MLRNLMLLGALTASLAACGGGSSGPDPATLTVPSGPLLRNAADEGTVVSTPVGVSLEGSSPTFALAADESLSVSLDDGTVLTFATSDAVTSADSGVTFFANNGNTDGAIIAVPSNSPLSFTSFGLWMNGSSADLTTVDGPFTVSDAGAGFFGIQTTPANMPATGSASYIGSSVGAVAVGTEIQDLLNGTFEATADFASSQLSVQMDLFASSGGDFAVLNADNATIDAAGSGFLTSADGASLSTGESGSMRGRFFGPGAEEIGGQFDLEGNGRRVFGAFGGSSQ